MSAEEYWFGDPHLIYRYENAFANKQKLQQQNMWLMGEYIRSAVASVPLNVAGFIQKKSQLAEYPECPHKDLFDEREKTPISEEERQLLETTRQRLLAKGLLAS